MTTKDDQETRYWLTEAGYAVLEQIEQQQAASTTGGTT